jgi:tetratricopeptide (TPR) repeat protein
MLAVSAFFAIKVFEHIKTLEDPKEQTQNAPVEEDEVNHLIEEGDAKLQEGDLQKALAIYSEANYKHKEDPEILFKMGYTLAQQERYEEAIERYKEALALDADNTYIHQALASAYRKMGEYTLARNHLDKAIALDATNPINYYNYGNLLVDMGAKDDAQKMYEKAFSLDNSFYEAQKELEKLQKEQV